jgi:signal peptidase II
MKPRRAILLFCLMACTVGCDRITKHMATVALAGAPAQSVLADTVRLEYVENTGGFLSMGADFSPWLRTAIFVVGTAFILLTLLVAGIKLRGKHWHLVGVCLLVAGGVSNLLDRVAYGAVVDFLNVGLGDGVRTGIFNVADVAILIGACVLILPVLVVRQSRP